MCAKITLLHLIKAFEIFLTGLEADLVKFIRYVMSLRTTLYKTMLYKVIRHMKMNYEKNALTEKISHEK